MRTAGSPRCLTVVADGPGRALTKEPLLIERASRLGVIGRASRERASRFRLGAS
jgi:uncharacterized glyoxalase superfamily metalloenzyme YdcJ